MTKLLSPFHLRDLPLSNRVVMAPMTRSRAMDTVPDALTALYYGQRAGAGLVITEGLPVSPQARGYLYTPGIYSAEQIAGWAQVTRQVHDKGGKIFAQLWHVGRMSHPSVQPQGKAPLAPVDRQAQNSSVFALDDGHQPGFVAAGKPAAMTLSDIQQAVEAFADAAENAIAAGFDGVEIHGANGYLLEQFINAGLNNRSDHYGGATLEGRQRFVLEVVDAVAARIGAPRTGIRLTPFSRLGDLHGFADEEATWLAQAHNLSQRNLAYSHIGNAATFLEPQANSDVPAQFLQKFRNAYHGPLIVAGGFSAEHAETVLEQGLADLVAFGRPFIANPDLVARFQHHWPLAQLDQSTLYSGGAAGYTDYPVYQAAE